MQYHRDRRAALLGRMKAPFQPTGGAIEKHFGHCASRK
jgi:hypothetical protein